MGDKNGKQKCYCPKTIDIVFCLLWIFLMWKWQKKAVVSEIRFAPCLARTSYQPGFTGLFIRHWHQVNEPQVCGFMEVFLMFCIVVIAITPFHKDD